jgi:hypothetical protein
LCLCGFRDYYLNGVAHRSPAFVVCILRCFCF